MTYIQTQAAFFAKATGLPKQALADDLTAHVLQLKGQLDAYAEGQLRAGVHADQRRVQAHVHDRRHAGRRDREAEGPRLDHEPGSRLQATLDGCSVSTRSLATWATQAGVSGGKNFPALGKQLDRNSVAISKAIGSLYGAAAAKQFLNGKNLWRAHINDFVAYTVATAKDDKAGQKKAVAKLCWRTSRCRPASSPRRSACRSRRSSTT